MTQSIAVLKRRCWLSEASFYSGAAKACASLANAFHAEPNVRCVGVELHAERGECLPLICGMSTSTDLRDVQWRPTEQVLLAKTPHGLPLAIPLAEESQGKALGAALDLALGSGRRTIVVDSDDLGRLSADEAQEIEQRSV